MQQAGRAGASAASAASRASDAAAQDPAGALQEATAAAFREASGAGEHFLAHKPLHPL